MKSKYFTLKEMLSSQTATRLGFNEQFNPSALVISNLEKLCFNILDPLREELGVPLKISSGYRCLRLNNAVGGAKNSQHLTGQASDVEGMNITNAEIFETIKKMNLPYDQLIWEFGNKKEPAWVHVSTASNPRKQIIYIGV